MAAVFLCLFIFLIMAVSSLIHVFYVLLLTAAIVVERGLTSNMSPLFTFILGLLGKVQMRDREQQISVLDVLEARCL